MVNQENVDLLKIEGFEWDSGNTNKNRFKHNVSINECEEVFFNQPRLTLDDSKYSTEKEKRYRVFGITTKRRKLALAMTLRNNKIRVIMARDQNKKERVFFDIETK